MIARQISVVIPVYNEQENIKPLFQRLTNILEQQEIEFEAIFIDDHSTDRTVEEITSIQSSHPILCMSKKGKKGKGYSLIEGFSLAMYPVIAMIDADLQYPPEAIPEMMNGIEDGMDIMVANRIQTGTGIVRKLSSKVFHYTFTKLLHGLNVDAQSGLKVFRKDVLTYLQLHPTAWGFDLEFLTQAKQANLRIGSVDIIFAKRFSGKSKISLLPTIWQLSSSAIKLKFQRQPVINFSDQGFYYKGKRFFHYSGLSLDKTAFYRVTNKQIITSLILFGMYLFFLLYNWHETLLVTFAAITFLYFIDLLFNLFLIIRSYRKHPEVTVEKISDREWPVYTIFCPLYKEWKVIPQFIQAMSALDYPVDKLQVMLILEEDDTESIENIRQFTLPSSFEVVIVPDSLPKTKPKACNYALQFAKGEHCVIYDAEDIPDSDQLKKTVLAFEQLSHQVICVQAKLNFYNPHHNILTRLFTAEYSLWFDLFLTGLQSMNAPIPLGGTSNHFRTNDIKQLGGWDAFNVTEDCDLGMRLAKNNYRTAIIDSTTQEEANSSIPNWFGQRTRWIKGYMQTYLVHMRHPFTFSQDWKHPHLLFFQLIVGGKILSMLINPLLWIVTISYFTFRPVLGPIIESLIPAPVLYTAVFSAVVGNFLYLYYYLIGCLKRQYYDIIKYAFLIPIYWIMMSMATWNALYNIIVKPHYWFKTKHGLHLTKYKDTTSDEINDDIPEVHSQLGVLGIST